MIKKNRWTPDQALTELKRWCAIQERSHEEVKTKLIERGIYGDEVDRIISELITENFINELRFAKAYVSGKFKINGWGRNKILQGLKQHKISSYNIQKSLATIEEDAYEYLLKKTMLKKKELISASGLELKQKLYNYLAQKGFEAGEIQKCMAEILDDK
ncbi:MAG: regulatory protein RecX [Saprospiraceae bacterium]